MKKKSFSFFDTKNFLVFVIRSQFSQSSWNKLEINIFEGQVEIISENVKKFIGSPLRTQQMTDTRGLGLKRICSGL